MIHLDTSFLIRALVAGSEEDRRLRTWLRDGEEIGISAIGWAEFLCGPLEGDLLVLATHVIGEPIAFLPDDAQQTARLFDLAGRRRGSFGDCMIAAVAIRVGARLATSNRRDFQWFVPAGLALLPA